MSEPTHDATHRGNGSDVEQAPGLARGAAALGVTLLDATERLACRAIEAGARVASTLLRSAHGLASELIDKTADTLQQIVDLTRETTERALEAAGSAVEGAGRFGERTATSVADVLSPIAGNCPPAASNGALASGRFLQPTEAAATGSDS